MPARSWYALGLLLACYVFSYIDRQVLSLVVQPLKLLLNISDTKIGLLQGFAFAVCYAVMGIPLARAADYLNRARIVAGCAAVWSVATMACGVFNTYAGFLLARAATAVSEAGLPPAALSLLTDLFPRGRLARATSIFMTGPFLGGGLALLGGGWLLEALTRHGGLTVPWIGHLLPWKAMFICIGAPGLGLALLALTTLAEPPRRDPPLHTRHTQQSEVFSEKARPLITYLRRHAPMFIPFVCSVTCIVVALFAMLAWTPTYFTRAFGVSAQDAGRMLGPLYLIAGLGGSLVAGWLAGGPNDVRILKHVFHVILIAALTLALASVALISAHRIPMAVCGFTVASFACSLVVTLAPLPLQVTAPNAARGQTIALCAFIYVIVGGGGGPFSIGFITDHILRNEQMVGRSLGLTTATMALCALAAGWIGLRAVLALGREQATSVSLDQFRFGADADRWSNRKVVNVTQIRRWHSYIGLFIAPSVLFFALTGATQLFGLHEAHGGYRPAAVVEKLSSVHKDQVFAFGEHHDDATSEAEAGKSDVDSTHKEHEEEDDHATVATLLLKVFFLLVALCLTVSTALGVWMGFTQLRRKSIAWLLMAIGSLVPLGLVIF
jgi:MFS family permease